MACLYPVIAFYTVFLLQSIIFVMQQSDDCHASH